MRGACEERDTAGIGTGAGAKPDIVHPPEGSGDAGTVVETERLEGVVERLEARRAPRGAGTGAGAFFFAAWYMIWT